jgi:hypothetical protein
MVKMVEQLISKFKFVGSTCSMQMLTDWSRTRFLKVVFTSIIISSYVELCETVYLFVFRIRRIFMCSTIV